ncbi:hypothetical protein WA158_004389 [Blastocystis sp. Blastoise]
MNHFDIQINQSQHSSKTTSNDASPTPDKSNDHVVIESDKKKHNSMISKLNNFFYGYSVSIIPIITKIHETIYESEDDWITSLLSSSIFVGSLAGLIIFGILGDRLGRAKGIRICMVINLIGILGSTFSFSVFSLSVPEMFIIFRIITGIGNGGMIPLTIVLSSESEQKDKKKTGVILGLLQSFGWLLGPVCLYIYFLFFSSSSFTLYNYLWRIVIFIPIIAPLYTLWSPIYETHINTNKSNINDYISSVFQYKYLVLLIGTGGVYLLYDIISYGMTMISPYILSQVINLENTPKDTAFSIIISGIFGTVGQLLSFQMIKRFSLRIILLQSFIINSTLFYGTSYFINTSVNPLFLLFIYYMTFFITNYGPGTVTILLPPLLYPSSIRTTYYAFSAGMGKIGAIIGSGLSINILTHYGINNLLYLCTIISILGYLTTIFFIPRETETENETKNTSTNVNQKELERILFICQQEAKNMELKMKKMIKETV